jgi:hypothetical protein
MTEHTHDAAPVEVAAAPPQPAPALSPSVGAQLTRSASAMGNQAFGQWAQTAGAGGDAFPSLSAHRAWGGTLARAPGDGGTATAPPAADQANDDDTPEPIEVKGMQFGKSVLDGIIPEAGGDLSKTFSTHLGKQASFGPYGLQVPLFPGVFASFGAGGAMSAKADASLTLTGTNVLNAVSGRAKKQEATASGTGTAVGTIAASMAAGLHVGVPGLANVGVAGQGTLAFRAEGDARFAGSIKRFKPKGEKAWLPWSGELTFDANVKGSLIAAAGGYFEYQVLWIYEDKFGHFKIGEWTLAEAGLHVTGSIKPGTGLQVDIKPWVGDLVKPGFTPEIRRRTQEERDKAEKLAHQGEAGVPPIARRFDARLARDDEPPPAGPPPATPPPPDAAAGGAAPASAPPGAAAVLAGGGDVTIEAEPRIEDT